MYGDEMMMVEVAESVDNGSPRTQSPRSQSLQPRPMNRSTRGFCRRQGCGTEIGQFYNAFSKITGTYYLPNLLGSYSILLREHGRRKPASTDTELNGCLIQPLSCPGCQDFLGFNVTEAPDEKQSYRGRDFFKLSRIELRCEEAPGRFYTVEPQVDEAPLLIESSPVPIAATVPMEVDSRPPPPLSIPRHYQHHNHQHHHYQDPSHQMEHARQPLPPPTARSPPVPLSSTLSQKSPSNLPLPSPSVKPVQHVQPTPARHVQSPSESRINGRTYPRSTEEVKLDAIERLQTQISQNSSTLAAHSQNIRQYEDAAQEREANLRREFQTSYIHQRGEIQRAGEAVERVQIEMQSIRELIETTIARAGLGQSATAQDSAVELMAQQVAVISHRTNEIDTLKITIEIMKNKIQRLEEAAAATLPAQPGRPYASPREPAAQSLQSSQAAASYHQTPISRTQSYQSHGSPPMGVTAKSGQREPPPSQGWATVNAGTKRTLVNGLDSPRESIVPISPKRMKLAPIEPRTYTVPSTYEYADSDSEAARTQSHSHTLPSQPLSHSMVVESTLPSQHSRSPFVPYHTQDAPSEDSWRPESQRIVEVRTPRGRGRGGGPGTRGRPRKSMTPSVPHPIGTPEWERRESWQGTPSQMSPDGYYMVSRPTRGIIRRGSGGGGSSRGGRPASSHGRAMSLGLQGVTAGVGIGLPADPYAHTKKTRTKPIRNADGILIRKDGRPDMRSQSSAANLRKVHAKREEGDESPETLGFTPSQLQSSMMGADTPSPTTGYHNQNQHHRSSEDKRHSHVLHKMFPQGIEKSRQEHDYARKVFQNNQDHTAHPRAQNHLHSQQHHEGHHIKREQVPVRNFDNGDVDIEDHADDEGQSDGSPNDSQYHDAMNEEEQQQQQHAPPQPQPQPQPESVVQVQASNTTMGGTAKSSQTLAANSTQAT